MAWRLTALPNERLLCWITLRSTFSTSVISGASAASVSSFLDFSASAVYLSVICDVPYTSFPPLNDVSTDL